MEAFFSSSHHKPVAPIGFMEAKLDGFMPVSGTSLDFYRNASIFYVLY